jgi:hypothetical protein
MFDEFTGLPLHVLVIHFAVVLVPATATLALVFAAVSRWRWLLRWPLALAAPAALAVTGVALLSGKAMADARPEIAQLVVDHENAGERLLILMSVFTVLALVAVVTLGGTSALASGRGDRRGIASTGQLVIAVLLGLVSIVCIYQVVITGDLGARAVWG